MGGTSCDVCVVDAGEVRRTDSREIEGRPIQLPMVDVHTVGAGGGSIGWRDAGGALRVGPRSAGAEPGPACYGRGGTEPTVTDANLLLGYLSSDSDLAGGVALDVEAARGSAVGSLGEQLGLGEIETAEGIVRVANQEMIRALRVIDRRARRRSARLRAAPLRRRRPDARRRAGRRARDHPPGLPPRQRRPLGARTDRRRPPPRHRPHRAAVRRTRSRAERIAAEVRALSEPLLAGHGGTRSSRSSTSCATAARPSSSRFPVRPEPDPDRLAEDFAREHEARYGYRDPGGQAGAGHDPGRGRRAGPGAAPAGRRRRAAGRGRARGPLRRRLGRRRECCGASRRPASRPRAPASSSCPRRRSCSRRAGALPSMRPARSRRRERR